MSFENILSEKVQRLVRDGAQTSSDQIADNEFIKIKKKLDGAQTSVAILNKDYEKEEEVKELTLRKCGSVAEVFQLFESTSIERILEETEKVSLLKFEITEHFQELNSAELVELSKKCTKKSIVVFLASKNYENFSIYWKSNEITKFLALQPYDTYIMRTNRTLFEFIANFLTKSLRNKHLGLCKLDNRHELTEFELHFLADHRGFNVLLVAAEMGDAIVVEILLKLDISTESPFKNVNAQTLAYTNQHFQVLLLLLNANVTFPVGMDVSKCSVEVQNFVSITRNLHEFIEVGNISKVTEIVQGHPHLQYFYNESNDSALAAALGCNKPNVYEALLVNEIKFGPHEKIEGIMEELEYETQRAVREIHFKNLKDMAESHLNVLMASSSVSHDALNPKEMTSHVQNAFSILNAIPLVRIILMVVAASKKFKIIFDFNRDTVQVADPTSGAYTNGLFYLSGRIYIGAMQLIDESTRNLTLATLAHELCHYAINLTYRNDAKPYAPNDNQTMREFEEVSKNCKENQEKEEVIELVYGCYQNEMHHAELAVRVAHLMALYHDMPERLQQARDNFNGLFNFIEEKVVPQMTEAIPDIESNVDREIENKDKKISKLTWSLYIVIILGIIVAVLVGVFVHNPTYKFGDLSEKQQSRIRNGNVLYKNVELKLSDLFPGNSMVYDNLTSYHISQLLKNEVLDFDDSLLFYLEKQIVFDWKSMAGQLKQKVLGSSFNFQGQIVKFMEVDLEAQKSLTSDEIRLILNGTEIEVGEKVKSYVAFYVDRNFIPDDANMLWYEYKYGHDYIDDPDTEDKHINNRTSNKTFHEFCDEFLKQGFDDRVEILSKVRKNVDYKKRFFDLNNEVFHFMYNNATEIIEQARNEKILVLSYGKFARKTITFEQLALKIKQSYPASWVSYIDLKKYTKFFQKSPTAEHVQVLIEKILNLGSKSEFEQKLFEKSFKSGTAVLLWNGFDEISPIFSKFVLNLTQIIRKNTQTVQLVCTRPLYSEQLKNTYRIRAWQPISFDNNGKRKYLQKFFESKNVPYDKINENVQKVEEIIKKFQFNDNVRYHFKTPLMLTMVAEIQKDGNLSESANMYEIFDAFVNKKIKFWLNKTNQEDIAKNFQYFHNLGKIYQKHALLSSLNLFSGTSLGIKLSKLQIMQTRIPEGLSNADISGMGILFINKKNEFEFAHRTFQEFFVAKFFIDNVYNADDFTDINELELRLELFFRLTQTYGSLQKIITDFMNSYLDIKNNKENFSDKISELLRSKFKKFLFRLLDTDYPGIFESLFKFFQNDHDLLIDLLHVNEDETFYTAIFNPNYFAQSIDPEKIKNLAQKYLTDKEFEKFLTGKNQKGKILFGLHFYRLIGRTKSNEIYEADIKVLNGTSFWDFSNIIKGKLAIDEQKELFVIASSPKIYLFYDKIFNLTRNVDNDKIYDDSDTYNSYVDSNDFLEYEKLWPNYENLFSQNEMQKILENLLIQYFEIRPDDKSGHEFFLNLLLKKVDEFLSNSQIYDMFLTKNILHEAQNDLIDFETLWTFLTNRTNQIERRNILLQDDEDENFYKFHILLDSDKIYSSYRYGYFCYDFTPLKIFHRSMYRGGATYEYVKEIYEDNFNKSELQDIILSSNDFFLYAIGGTFEKSFGMFVLFLEDIFKGNEKSLRNLLDRKVKPTKFSILKYVDDFRGLSYSEQSWFNNLAKLTDLYSKIKSNSGT